MKSPTANVLNRVVWLGDGRNMAQGSGTLVSFEGVDYLATAHHVCADCGGNPSVRFRGLWNPFQWELVAKDENLDVIVLKSPQLPSDLAERLPVLYGVPQGAVHGQIGYSLGFPGVHESATQLKTDHVPEIEGLPIPIAALVVINLSIDAKVHYSASYINSGFPGVPSCTTSKTRRCGRLRGLSPISQQYQDRYTTEAGRRPECSRSSILGWSVMCRCPRY